MRGWIVPSFAGCFVSWLSMIASRERWFRAIIVDVRGLLLLVGLASCDYTFRLDRVTLFDAGSGDGSASDGDPANDLDGDGFAADDNCPLIHNPDQFNDDPDPIGNACDPHPGQFDVIVGQETFDGAISSWQSVGAWTKEGGVWTSPDAAAGGSMALAPRALYRPAIQVGFRILAHDTLAPTEIRELQIHLDAPALQGDCCVRHHPLSSVMSQIVMHVEGTTFAAKNVDTPYVFDTPYVATYTRALTSTCGVANYSLTRPDMVEQFTATPLLVAVHIQVAIDHVTLYQVVQ